MDPTWIERTLDIAFGFAIGSLLTTTWRLRFRPVGIERGPSETNIGVDETARAESASLFVPEATDPPSESLNDGGTPPLRDVGSREESAGETRETRQNQDTVSPVEAASRDVPCEAFDGAA